MVAAILSIDIRAQLGSFLLDVEFSVSSGITVITGASGSGKSSILNCVAGLKKPDAGLISCSQSIFFDSKEGINLPSQKRSCGYVLQNLALFPHLNVAENICFGIDKQNKDEQAEKLAHLLSLVKLEGMEKRAVTTLSGGQLQRVALARALAPAPKLLLLDEPFSALDAELREELGLELRALERNLLIPILMVTHSKAEALSLADSVVLMENGKIKDSGYAAEILNAKRSELNHSAQFSW